MPTAASDHRFRPTVSRRGMLALLGAAGVASQLRPAWAAAAVEKSVKLSPGLYELVVSTTTGLVHVASTGMRGSNDAKILGLDPRTLDVRSTVALGADGAFGLAVNDQTGTLYGTETRAGKLLAIDLRSGTVKARVGDEDGAHLRQVLVDEAHNRAFVSVFGARGKPSAIWVVDTASNTLAAKITDGLDGGVTGLAYNPATGKLYAAAMLSNEVIEVDVAGKAGGRRFASGGEAPINLAFDPTSNRLYCANQKSGQLSVLDAASGQAVKVLDTGAGALGVTLSGDGALAYVANRGAGTVSLVDTRGLAVMASLETGTHPNTVAVDRRSGLAYVTNKARMAPRGQPPVDDPNGDTVSLIRA